MAKIGILGGDGFLGSEILNVLYHKEHEVHNITRASYSIYKNESFDIFINCNGNSKKYMADRDPLFDFDANIRTTFETLNDFHFQKYIYISSVDVYTGCIYGVNKKIAEFLLHQYSSLINFRLCVIRPASIIGKNMQKGILYDILNNQPLRVDPKSTFQFITNTEIANFIEKILIFNNKNLSFNLAGTTSVDIPTLEYLTDKTIAFAEPPLQLQNYKHSVFFTEAVFPLKTSEEYIKDCLNGY